MTEEVKQEEKPAYVGKVLPLVRADNKVLFTPTEEFDFKDPPVDTTELALDLLATMRKHKGYGLSATQVGLPYRVFVMDTFPTPFVCFNPKIVSMSTEQSPPLEEACLSFPGIVVKLRRPLSIRVRFQTPNGNVTTQTFMGMTSRCFVHELAHLDGEPFFKGIGRMKMEKALKDADIRGYDYSRMNFMKYAISD